MKVEIGPFKWSSSEKPKKPKKPPMEFSKKILVVSWVSGSLITIYGLWLTYKMVIGGYSGDVSIIITILGGAFAEITAGTSFYYLKARAENIAKIEKQYGEEIAGKVKEEIE